MSTCSRRVRSRHNTRTFVSDGTEDHPEGVAATAALHSNDEFQLFRLLRPPRPDHGTGHTPSTHCLPPVSLILTLSRCLPNPPHGITASYCVSLHLAALSRNSAAFLRVQLQSHQDLGLIDLLGPQVESGCAPAKVTGSSAGALVAAVYASGMPLDRAKTLMLALTRHDILSRYCSC